MENSGTSTTLRRKAHAVAAALRRLLALADGTAAAGAV